jgi:hypothetical protein
MDHPVKGDLLMENWHIRDVPPYPSHVVYNPIKLQVI